MKYHYLYTGELNNLKSAHLTADSTAEDRNDEEKEQLKAVKSFLDHLQKVYDKDKDGKFTIDVRGESKHDGAGIELSFTLRKVVLRHQNALEGSAAAFPPGKEEQVRKEDRITRTQAPSGEKPLPGAPEPLVGGVTTSDKK